MLPRTKDYLINFARSLIYTTALSESAVADILVSLELVQRDRQKQVDLLRNIDHYGALARSLNLPFQDHSPIQYLPVSGNDQVREAAVELTRNRFRVVPILHPTVPEGMERIRVSLHAYNRTKDIDDLLETFQKHVS
ncbi:hypothetical protein KFE98_13785 [bacterium SCSIO 12741]|nr:hypothetical protein KFE98_13785 [bacterium SCSIO 12741]